MNINYRLLEKEDYNKGFLNVVNYFTKNEQTVNFEDFKNHYNKIINQNSLVYVAEYDNKIIGTNAYYWCQFFYQNI